MVGGGGGGREVVRQCVDAQSVERAWRSPGGSERAQGLPSSHPPSARPSRYPATGTELMALGEGRSDLLGAGAVHEEWRRPLALRSRAGSSVHVADGLPWNAWMVTDEISTTKR
ncbi:hypothetical protein BS78_08G151900 [Paspalum vaginatum]|nr:hypothetical protein BS78_08G151900 [Paspalum vaginatum]